MSLVFNDTTTGKGIVQMYEKEAGFNRGDISGSTSRLKDLTADVNLAFDDFTRIALAASGTWQEDDSNQTDYPIISTNLVSGQRDYTFTTDGSGNLVLDVYKVMVASSSGIYTEIKPVDVQSQKDTDSFYSGQNTTGTPTRYDKTANGIFLDVIPNYNYTGGLKVYINREPSYFVYTDTTKKPGVPGIFHRYFALKPALDWARRNTLANYPLLASEVLKMEGDEGAGIVGTIAKYFSARTKDEPRRLVVGFQDNK